MKYNKGEDPIKYNLRVSLAESGTSVTATSMTAVIGFGFGSIIYIPGIRSFCVFALIAFLLVYILQFMLFVPLFITDRKNNRKRLIYNQRVLNQRKEQETQTTTNDKKNNHNNDKNNKQKHTKQRIHHACCLCNLLERCGYYDCIFEDKTQSNSNENSDNGIDLEIGGIGDTRGSRSINNHKCMYFAFVEQFSDSLLFVFFECNLKLLLFCACSFFLCFCIFRSLAQSTSLTNK